MKILKYSFLLAVAFALLLSGCETDKEKAEKHHFDNMVYISTTDIVESLLFTEGDDATQSTTLSIAMADMEDDEVTATVVVNSNLLSTYQEAYYDEDAELFPVSNVTIEDGDLVIEPGSVSSESATITFSGLGSLDREVTYVLPVQLTDVQGADLLESKSVMYYVFEGSSLINVVCGITSNRGYPDFNDEDDYASLTALTFEALIYADSFPNTLHTLMGIEGNFLLRFGDSGVDPNQLQLATSAGNLTSTDLAVNTGEWYHIAVTFDAGTVVFYYNGVQKYTGTLSLSSVDLSAAHNNEDVDPITRCFWVGYAYSSDRYFDGYFSELRIWNRALTSDEINETNHFYTVDGDSEGLIAYWKLNEGAGTTGADSSEYGHDLTFDSTPVWKSVALPED